VRDHLLKERIADIADASQSGGASSASQSGGASNDSGTSPLIAQDRLPAAGSHSPTRWADCTDDEDKLNADLLAAAATCDSAAADQIARTLDDGELAATANEAARVVADQRTAEEALSLAAAQRISDADERLGAQRLSGLHRCANARATSLTNSRGDTLNSASARRTARSETNSGAPIEGVNGNWRCNTCSNVNFKYRTKCNRCDAPRGSPEAADGQWSEIASRRSGRSTRPPTRLSPDFGQPARC
jgi:hypothetical protein